MLRGTTSIYGSGVFDAHLLLPAAVDVAAKARDSAHFDAWKLIGTVGGIIGLIAAVQQLLGSFRRRRYHKAEERLLHTMATTIDAESAREEAERLEALRAALRQQVEEEVPLEARRIFLRTRRDALRSQIASDVEEHTTIERELAEIEGRTALGLDERLRPTIEKSILPPYVRRRRVERGVVAALAVLLVLTVTPLGPRWVEAQWRNYSHSIYDPSYYPDLDLMSSLVFGALAVGAAALVLTRARLSRGFPSRRAARTVIGASATAALIGVVLLASGLITRHDGVEKYGEANRLSAREAELMAKRETAKSNTARSKLRRQIKIVDARSERVWREAEDDSRQASLTLWPGHLMIGASLGILGGFAWLRRRHRVRRVSSTPQPAAASS